MKPTETILGMGGEGIRRIMEGVNLAMLYHKHFCKCHSVPSVQQYDNTFKKQKKKIIFILKKNCWLYQSLQWIFHYQHVFSENQNKTIYNVANKIFSDI
jgi:hypothetical protein